MKKLLLIVPLFFFSFMLKAQGTQTEDEVYIGKGKTFGNYRGTIKPEIGKDLKTVNGLTAITGTVISVEWCEEDCYTIKIKRADSSTLTFQTKLNGFVVPRGIVGRTIIIETKHDDRISGRRRKDLKKEYSNDIQFAAQGIKVID